jgi:hypothetical protein
MRWNKAVLPLALLPIALATVAAIPLRSVAAVRLLVPAYFDPSTTTGWNTLISSVSPQVPITAIMNPNSGPVATVDPAYTSAITNFESAGGEVVAYIHTTNGSRSLSSVEKDVATYESEYPNIQGFFVDEMANTASKLNYYKNLYTYIKSQNSTLQVIGNPGTSTLSTYLSPTPAAANELVTFENNTGYSTYTPSSWQSSYNASSFANIVYAVPDVATMQSDLSLAITDRAANVYFTDLSGTNPYASLPSYWSAETAAVSRINSPLKATYKNTGAGDYNNPGNWTAAIPNGIDAEADFLTAITANHTVYSDQPITLGTLIFNNPHSYFLAGAGGLTIQASTGPGMIEALAGNQTVSLPISLLSSTTLSASAGASLIITGPLTVAAGQTLTEAGAGTIQLLGTVTLQAGASANFVAGGAIASLSVGPAAAASLIAPPSAQAPAALTTQTIYLATNSRLNLQNQGLIVSSGDVSTLQQLVHAGNISDAGSSLNSIAVISNNVAGTLLYSTFNGSAVTLSDVLIKSALLGDTNLDGKVDHADYARAATGYSDHLSGWYNGDFNYDGIVDGSDFTLMDNAYNSTQPILPSGEIAQITSEIATVPEPRTGEIGCFISMVLASSRNARKFVSRARR